MSETETPQPVSLEQMLQARERRAADQQAALRRYARPVVSLSLVTPGPLKDGSTPRLIFAAALDALDAAFARLDIPLLASCRSLAATGPEALYVVAAPAAAVKRHLIALETAHPLGRLWDIDVICPQAGSLTRRGLGLPPRPCLLCGEAAHACARSRRHSPASLQAVIEERVRGYLAA